MGLCEQLAACIADRRDPTRVIHTLPDILRARIFAICCGYEDADDLDTLRDDPGFRFIFTCCKQPTLTRSASRLARADTVLCLAPISSNQQEWRFSPKSMAACIGVSLISKAQRRTASQARRPASKRPRDVPLCIGQRTGFMANNKRHLDKAPTMSPTRAHRNTGQGQSGR